MAEKFTLSAQRRDVSGKEVRFLRREGFTPAVIYRGGQDALSVQVGSHDLELLMARAAKDSEVLVHVEGEAKPRRTRFHDIQRHVTRLNPIHVDFIELG